MLGLVLAAFAGLCGALASVFGKLAMAGPAALAACEQALLWVATVSGDASPPSLAAGMERSALSGHIVTCEDAVMCVRVVCFGMLFVSNAVMWTLFVKALQACPSTVEATIVNTAANLIATALFGRCLFGEGLSLLWWLGASFIVAGMVLVTRGNVPPSEDKTEKQD